VNDDGEHPTVLVSNRQELPVDEDELAGLARDTLLGEGIERGELSVSFITEEEMADLHARYMGEEGPTDVLSFGLDDARGPGEDVPLLGDVVIAPTYAARAAGADGALERELRLLLVHGILHLLGYDHEEEGERAVMWARQESYSGVRA